MTTSRSSTTCCSRRSRRRNSSPSIRWRRSPSSLLGCGRARSPAPISRSTAAGRPNKRRAAPRIDESKKSQSRAAGRRLARRLHLGRPRLSARGRPSRHCGGQRHQRRGDECRRPCQGWLENGREGAREALQRFWRAISTEKALSPAQAKFFDLFFGPQTLGGQFSSIWGDFFTHFASPYQFNPFDVNPLRDYLLDAIDFEKVRAFNGFKIFVAATNVHTARSKCSRARN